MHHNADRLLELKQVIYNSLDPLIDRDYCLLDIPNHPNIGDQLIYEGELEYLKRFDHKMIYESNEKYGDLNKIPSGCLILLHGGGNFGYIGNAHQEFRRTIIDRFINNRIIIFPQTVFYKSIEKVAKDKVAFDKHPDLTICVRDQVSYDFMKQHFVHNNILLLPDMAFCLDLRKYVSDVATDKALVIVRRDKELNKNFELIKVKSMISSDKKVDIRDWPTMGGDRSLKFLIASTVNYLNRELSAKFDSSSLLRPLLGSKYGLLRGSLYRKWHVREGIKFINQYDEVYTTRLHGYILSVLLDKRVFMLDNSYGKNRNFYETWMTKFENSYFV